MAVAVRDTEIIRTEIVTIVDEDGVRANQWSLVTLRDGNGGTRIELGVLGPEWRPGDPQEGPTLSMPFGEARIVAIGMMRSVYHEMPKTWYLAEGDPEEYLSHLLEMIYEMTPSNEADQRDGLKNILVIRKQNERALRLIGIARRNTLKWRKRFLNAAMWARKNQGKIIRQRRQIRGLMDKNRDLKIANDPSPITKSQARLLYQMIIENEDEMKALAGGAYRGTVLKDIRDQLKDYLKY